MKYFHTHTHTHTHTALPDSLLLPGSGDLAGVMEVELSFSPEFSNVLLVAIKARLPQKNSICTAIDFDKQFLVSPPFHTDKFRCQMHPSDWLIDLLPSLKLHKHIGESCKIKHAMENFALFSRPPGGPGCSWGTVQRGQPSNAQDNQYSEIKGSVLCIHLQSAG